MNAPAPYGARRPPPRDPPRGAQYGAPYGEAADDGWSQSTPVRASYLDDPASRARDAEPRARGPERRARGPERRAGGPEPRERGLPAWGALLVLLVIAGGGGLIDTVSGSQVRGGFNIGIVAASIVAMLVVRRSSMFPVVISPPLVYAGASAAMLYLRSGGLHDKKVLFDGAANWLVYGFPAIASATAAVLIIAGARMIMHR